MTLLVRLALLMLFLLSCTPLLWNILTQGQVFLYGIHFKDVIEKERATTLAFFPNLQTCVFNNKMDTSTKKPSSFVSEPIKLRYLFKINLL